MRLRRFFTTAAMVTAVSVLAACGGKDANNTGSDTTQETTQESAPVIDSAQMVSNIYQAVVERYDAAYYPQMKVQEEEYFMQDTLKLDKAWYDAAIVEVPMMTNRVDTFAIIHPTSGNLENVKKALDDYKSYLINDSFQYPMNMSRVHSAVVEVIDNEYVLFSILTGMANVEENSDEETLLKAYEESSRIAVEVANGVVKGEIVVEPWTEMDMIRNEIVKFYGTAYYPNMKIHEDAEYLKNYMNDVLKIDAAWVEDIIVEVPMISANADTLILVQPTEGNAENVLNALKEYKNYLINEAKQYPMNEARVHAAAIEQVGNYVCFSILGGVVDDPAGYGLTNDKELAEYYETMNMTAIDAIKVYLGIVE